MNLEIKKRCLKKPLFVVVLFVYFPRLSGRGNLFRMSICPNSLLYLEYLLIAVWMVSDLIFAIWAAFKSSKSRACFENK